MAKHVEEREIAEIFQSLDLMAGLPEEAIRELARISRRVWAYRGQTILEEGEEAGELLILLEGRVGVYLESINPSIEVAINKLSPGDVIGEMSLLEGGPRSATVIAMDRCHLAALPCEELSRFIEDNPAWGLVLVRNIAVSLSARLRIMNRRVLNLTRVRYF